MAQFSHLCLELFFVKICFQYLVLRARDLASLMTSRLIKKSFEFNRSICQQYDYIVNRITSSAKTTEELVDLEKYIDNLRSGPLVHLRVCYGTVPTYFYFIGSLSKDDDDTRTSKIAVGKICKTTTLHVHHAFSCISLPSLHDCEVKRPIFTFSGDVDTRQQFSNSFLSLDTVL